MICRCCGRHNLEEVMYLDDVPKDVQHLLPEKSTDPKNKYTSNICVYQCQNCGLTQSPVQLNTDYYDDYLMTTSFSARLQSYLDELVDRFISGYGKNSRKILDIGCGDGAFMEPFRRRNIDIEGIEPSQLSRDAATQAGYHVYPGYMTADTVLDGAPYDAFVTRQVLEHVHDINGFFRGLKRNLAPGAYGIIEIPRLEKTLTDLRFYDFFPDHINYFSLDTLRTTLEINGFDVLEVDSSMDDEYNVAFVQMRSRIDLAKVKEHRAVLVQEIGSLVRSRKDSRIAMWGAGAKGLSILAAIIKQNVTLDAIVDSDPNKLGKFTSVGGILVQPPESLLSGQISTVIVSAIAYERTIIKKLMDMNFQGDIYLIRAQGLELHKEIK